MSPSTGSAAPTAARRIFHTGSVGLLAGGLLLIIGAFTPWVSTPLGNLNGMAGPGLWVLCAGGLALAGALLPYRRVALAHAIIPAAAAGGLVLWQLGTLVYLSMATDSWGKLLPGVGLVIVGAGTVLLVRAARRMSAASPA
ncbi:hypothetical protein [Streptomonospora litoralis]|uniref:Uncharacterized protein n=1 Tax=Streptomonospora litoralis TaxID=2498135 RepID=A0A4P6Q7V2_9ACTN|nr:hypothetical protein [Streptomonospora litoralis]QBI54937.1 hypothetical protein EKD16_15825 [Streptomonospora litoralis]